MNKEQTLEFLSKAADLHASDIFIIAGRPLSIKTDGRLSTYGDRLMPEQTSEILEAIYQMANNRDISRLHNTGDDDFSFSIPGLSRFRINAYKQRGSLAAVIRVIAFQLPDPAELSIPEDVMSIADLTKGMVLVTGSAGSGKSTTMACLIDRINHSREGHIITLEDPLEYLHRHDRCIVSQREICTDTENYITSLRATLRQSPDVILLGEMRDHETIQTAMTAAETGHLILSSLHTLGAANSLNRIIDVFEPSQQHQIIMQLSMVLQAVISQQLVPDVNGKNIPVFEIMRLTPAIRAFTVFCRRDFDSACDDPCGFWKAAGQNVQKGICFLVYFCISDEWNPAAVPPVYGYDESVFCNCVSRICGAERNTKPVGKHSGRTEADLRGTSDTE